MGLTYETANECYLFANKCDKWELASSSKNDCERKQQAANHLVLKRAIYKALNEVQRSGKIGDLPFDQRSRSNKNGFKRNSKNMRSAFANKSCML